MKSTEKTRDLSGLRQELQRFISDARKNQDPSQSLTIYLEQLKKILRKHIYTGAEKQHEKIR